MEINFVPYLRISSIAENEEEGKIYLNVEGEIIPRYSLGLPEIDQDLEKPLRFLYKKHFDNLPELIGKVIKDMSIETMLANEKSKRAAKLENLKMVVIDSGESYNNEHVLLNFYFKFKPLMVPVFEPNFIHQGVIYSEPLDLNKIDT